MDKRKDLEMEMLEGKKENRDKYIDRIIVLDKVKELNCLSNTTFSTTKQVAEFYDVNTNLIQKVYNDNTEELLEDGVAELTGKEALDTLEINSSVSERVRGGILIGDEKLAYSKNTLYPKRAILRIGMLLRDSKVAKEIRTMLLNVHEDASQGKEKIIENINEDYTKEQELQARAGQAIMDGDMDEFMLITVEISALKNKRIAELENDIDILNYNTLTITDSRNAINAIVRKIASIEYGNKFGLAWAEFYKLLNYQEGINVKNRKGKGSNLDKLTDDEMEKAVKIAKNWASNSGLDVDDILSLYKKKEDK